MTQSRLRVVPVPNNKAKDYVDRFHRHHGSSVQARFSLGVVDEVTDGCENACSALYGGAARVARAMGYVRILTYIREDEPGTSLRASGWRFEQAIRARSWNMPGRPRTDKTEIVRRGRWSLELNPEPPGVEWPILVDLTAQGSLL